MIVIRLYHFCECWRIREEKCQSKCGYEMKNIIMPLKAHTHNNKNEFIMQARVCSQGIDNFVTKALYIPRASCQQGRLWNMYERLKNFKTANESIN